MCYKVFSMSGCGGLGWTNVFFPCLGVEGLGWTNVIAIGLHRQPLHCLRLTDGLKLSKYC